MGGKDGRERERERENECAGEGKKFGDNLAPAADVGEIRLGGVGDVRREMVENGKEEEGHGMGKKEFSVTLKGDDEGEMGDEGKEASKAGCWYSTVGGASDSGSSAGDGVDGEARLPLGGPVARGSSS